MKLQQLRFLATVDQSELNITTAAGKLYTTQPAVSIQLGQLEDELGAHPMVSHVFSFTGPSSLTDAIPARNMRPNIAMAARDADVIKTYVRLGIGVGIIANMAIDPVDDADLTVLDAAHLFPTHTTWVGFDRAALLRKYMYDFIGLLAPQLSRRVVDGARATGRQAETDTLFDGVELPRR